MHERFRSLFPRLGAEFGAHGIEALLARAQEGTFERGSTVATRGDRMEAILFVTAGSLGLSIGSGATRVALGEVGPGAWVGDVEILDDGVAAADIVAEAHTRAFVLSRTQFESLVREEPEVGSQFLHALSRDLAERLRATTGELVALQDGRGARVQRSDGSDGGSLLARLCAALLGAGKREAS